MGLFGKLHKTIPIIWEYPMLPSDNFTLDWVGTYIENPDIKFVTPIFDPSHLWKNTVDTV